MSASPPTDVELVRGLHARDRKALARVYADYHVAIYNLCARILGDREEAKDVTQEVFLKAFASPPAAAEDVQLRPWLFRVATNTCLNLIRSRRPGSLAEPDLVAATSDPFEQAQSAALIEGALGAMNERYRAALVLKDLHGVGGEELAGVFDISRPAADVLVHRAHAAFRRAFAALAGEDAVAPANLAVALPMLAVPAALQAFPLPAGPAGGGPGLVPPAAPGAGSPAAPGAGPTIGVLGKITAALGVKAAVIAAGAAVIAGGGIAAVELAGETHTPAPASAPAAVTVTGAGSGGVRLTADGSRIDLPAHRAHPGDHAGSHDGEGGHHSGDHAAGHYETAGDHTGAGSHTASSSHDATASHSSSGSTTTETHDGGDSGHDAGE